MERGTVQLSNPELSALFALAVAQGCNKVSLLNKLRPVEDSSNPNELHTVQISEEEAEVILDCLPAPSSTIDPNLMSSRIKIQEFITRCRFGGATN